MERQEEIKKETETTLFVRMRIFCGLLSEKKMRKEILAMKGK
jgi:hypothetical protein